MTSPKLPCPGCARLAAENRFLRGWLTEALLPAIAFNQRRPPCASAAAAEGEVAARLAEFRESRKGDES